MSKLHDALLEAHEAGDGPRLIELYQQAGDEAEARGDVGAACFFLTHAYVFALEEGSSHAAPLHRRLKAHGREE